MKKQNRSKIRFRLWHMFFFVFACSVTTLLVRNHMLNSEAIAIAQYWWTPCGAAKIRKGRKPNVNEWKTCSPQLHRGVQA